VLQRSAKVFENRMYAIYEENIYVTLNRMDLNFQIFNPAQAISSPLCAGL
jgi:hypothetical protein